MKVIFYTLILAISSANLYSQDNDKTTISKVLDKWHKDAATANGNGYFEALDKDAIYIGTDKTELWSKNEFYSFAKPYFDAGKAWNFTAIERNVYFSKSKNVAWFDELLNTWMGVCRGSGVLEKEGNKWVIMHYHLSVTIDNDKVQDFIKLSNRKVK